LVKTISVSASEDPQSKEMILANTYRMSMLYVGKAQITAIAPAKATSPAK
jgi:hypothetical protein